MPVAGPVDVNNKEVAGSQKARVCEEYQHIQPAELYQKLSHRSGETMITSICSFGSIR
jgi:hypothetical protein